MRAMTERQFDVLRWLDDERYVRPMDVGGRDASHHSETLAQCVKRGWAERRTRGSNHSFEYRRTQFGKDAVQERIDRLPQVTP